MVSSVRTSSPPSMTGTPAAAATRRPGEGAQFFRILTELGRKPDQADPAVREQAAAQLLSELFLKPMLAEMRQFPFGNDLMHGGQMESAFGERLDERMADIVAAGNQALVRQIVRYMDNEVTGVPSAAPAGDAQETPATATRPAAQPTRGEV